ncbi:peptide chain release factor N(5)-glutamine methyltransferase [Acidithiobacillus thiooxidans]|uniref:peptide chain release factor N(5)-glutamine methyltransferase n=1 Tax=Acidithiobacillus thiooxidans TaxID=930 RepID=UPI000262516A|nr:peptide chain release factor N(5)-glutamine methyltransferase [Acidithiobacillus thiooxidans]MBU2810993.1 peptide chain release factor N(5)-glutamine methyltransferase [Acidithiobacillus thiooxidans]
MISLQDWQRHLGAQLAAVSDQPIQEARWLMTHGLGLRSTELLINPQKVLTPTERAQLQTLLDQRLSGAPLAYCLGEWSFYGLDLTVTAAVLIPRPDSELLVSLALMESQVEDDLQLLDLGTGSGALALVLARERPQASVFAVEQSPEALAIARLNGDRIGVKNIQWLQGDWYTPLDPNLRFDQIISNPPYLASNDPHLPDLQHEPRTALVAGATGLECLEPIIIGARSRLRPGGRILLEHGCEQAAAVHTLLHDHGFQKVHTHCDLAGRERVSSARSPDHA